MNSYAIIKGLDLLISASKIYRFIVFWQESTQVFLDMLSQSNYKLIKSHCIYILLKM